MKERECEKLYCSLTNIWDELIEELDVPAKTIPLRSRRLWLRVAAVCACSLLLAATVLAVSGLGTQLLAMFTGRVISDQGHINSGYDLAADLKQFPLSAFSEKMLSKQQENPEEWKRFVNDAGARRYLGLDSIQSNTLPLEKSHCDLTINRSAEGRISDFHLDTQYEDPTIGAQTKTTILTEHYPYEFEIAVRYPDERTFIEEWIDTDAGLVYHVFYTVREDGRHHILGFLVADGILYEISLSYREEESNRCQALLCDWANSFQ